MSGRGSRANFGIEPQVGRIMTAQERAVRMADESASSIAGEELRSAFAVSDAYVLTAWHCVSDRADEVSWFRLRYVSIEGLRSVYVPMRLANSSSALDIAVLALDESSLDQAGLTRSTVSGILRAASFALSIRVAPGDPVRVMGFPLSAASADSDTNAAAVVDVSLAVGGVRAVKLFGDAFAAVDPVNPRGLSGGPVLKRMGSAASEAGPEAAVAIVRGVPRGRYPYTASGGSLIATHIEDAVAALPEIAQLPRPARRFSEGRAAARTEPLPRPAVPRQLPPRIAHFTGRTDDLMFLDALLGDARNERLRTAVISAIDGTAGVGKTALAIHWAHHVRAQFPDGDLYVNLHGYDFSTPADPYEVMEYFLRALGVPPADIPREPDARTALYRTVLYDRRALLVLDNAASVEQVAPLLPTSNSAFALITSRSRLPGLAATHATAQLPLDLMTEEEALELLTEVIGAERVARETDVAVRLVERCARLPLALRIVAENIRSRLYASLAAIYADLDASTTDLGGFATDDESLKVESVFDWSYQRLSDDDAMVFRRLGLHPGAQISAGSAAALIMAPVSAAERPLYRLAQAHLVEHAGDRTFKFHDLMRRYATEKCRAHDEPQVRQEAFRNLASWYTHTANNANKLMIQRVPISVEGALAGTSPGTFHGFADALAWCEAERVNMTLLISRAYEEGLLYIAWKLSDVLRGFYNLRKHWSDWEATHTVALDAARRLHDMVAEANLLNGMGTLLTQTGRGAQAISYHQAAVNRRRLLGDEEGVASSLDGLGTAYRHEEQLDEALECFLEGLAIRERVGDPKALGWSFNNLGETELRLGNHGAALDYLKQALIARIEVGDTWGQGRTLHGLGETYDSSGRLAEAREQYQAAVAVRTEISDRWGVAQSLHAWGDTERRLGNIGEARALWSRALVLLAELGDGQTAAVEAKLAATTSD
jgi:tetratricopeptide (TPR) repeat protein